MYRAMKQLDKMRSDKRKRSQEGQLEGLPRCPFVPDEAYEELKRQREEEQNEQSEATVKTQDATKARPSSCCAGATPRTSTSSVESGSAAKPPDRSQSKPRKVTRTTKPRL